MKWWNSTFNAQGLRVIIVVVHVGIVKIYLVVVQVLMKKETHDEIQIGGKTNLGSNYFLL